jgi:hypothetical protein
MESQQALVGAPASPATVASEQTQKFSLFALTMIVVGSMVGAGIFSLPRAFGNATGPFGAIIAWTHTRELFSDLRQWRHACRSRGLVDLHLGLSLHGPARGAAGRRDQQDRLGR